MPVRLDGVRRDVGLNGRSLTAMLVAGVDGIAAVELPRMSAFVCVFVRTCVSGIVYGAEGRPKHTFGTVYSHGGTSSSCTVLSPSTDSALQFKCPIGLPLCSI